jgi:hypothetical protein
MMTENDIKLEIKKMLPVYHKCSGENKARVQGFIKGLLFVLNEPLDVGMYEQRLEEEQNDR